MPHFNTQHRNFPNFHDAVLTGDQYDKRLIGGSLIFPPLRITKTWSHCDMVRNEEVHGLLLPPPCPPYRATTTLSLSILRHYNSLEYASFLKWHIIPQWLADFYKELWYSLCFCIIALLKICSLWNFCRPSRKVYFSKSILKVKNGKIIGFSNSIISTYVVIT